MWSFIARVSRPEFKPPTRGYLYEDGLVDTFGSIENARDYLLAILDTKPILMEADFLLAAVWGDGENKTVETFGYHGIDPWPGNPDIFFWVFRNGIYYPGEEQKECEDTTILRGREAEYRRTTKSLETYMENPPDISNFGSIIDL